MRPLPPASILAGALDGVHRGRPLRRYVYLGSGLALRSLLGFGNGALAPLALGVVLDATNPAGVTSMTWGWAFVTLGLGAAAAAWCAWGLARARH